MPRNNQRNRNHNPEGRNQYSGGWVDTARERPFTAAATAAAAVGAGVFLWSRRSQISEQISNLSDQISEWSDNINSANRELETAETGQGFGSSEDMTSAGQKGRKARRATTGLSEIGGGNASLGAQTGGNGID